MISKIKFKNLDELLLHSAELQQIFSQVKTRIFTHSINAGKDHYELQIKTFNVCLN